jgi:hypothetical protein
MKVFFRTKIEPQLDSGNYEGSGEKPLPMIINIFGPKALGPEFL